MSTDVTEDKNAQLQAKSPAIPARADQDVTTPFTPHTPKQHKRSVGLRAFDAFLYPFLNNTGVFVISVIATYLTNKGGAHPVTGELPFGKTGEFFFKRGEWLKGKFTGMGMSEKAADMSKMVFFSFADGTLLAPIVKLFEDRREKIASWIDNRLGTTPTDPAVYKAEPKQTWGSVLEGRLATSLIVVPTAVVLSKAGLNQVLFEKPGIKLGEMVAQRPKVAKLFGKLDIPEVFRVSAFEAFYTTVCTGGLYFISRLLARRHDQKIETQNEQLALGTQPATLALEAPTPAIEPATPRPSVSQVHHQDRLTPALGQHLTA